MTLWLLDKSAHVRIGQGLPLPDGIRPSELALCEMARLEWLYSTQSAADYRAEAASLSQAFTFISSPSDILDRVLQLQLDLAEHHGLWHRRSIADLFISETALAHDAGILHADRDFTIIAQVRPTLRLRDIRG